ncbi:2-dehydropantoate 2-reductase [Streptomyces sp. NPDC059740]|uniref:2-dehydropantoate 2-reductase n=1 Tax=Streptomyces sp. NPDC059740 TaxID=3346926 RepID=UPI003668AEF4
MDTADTPATDDGGQARETTDRRLRIAVFGAGNIGAYLGGMLADTAHVTLVGRSAPLAALRTHGLTLTATGTPARHIPAERLHLASTADAVAGADVVLVTVKSAATAGAAGELAPHLTPGALVVSLQNGLRNVDTLRRALPGHTVVAGMVPYNVVTTAPAGRHRGTAGTLLVADAPATRRLTEVLRAAGLAARTHPDMAAVQHAKLLMNLNNAVNALSGLPLREQLGDRAYRRCLARCQTEALAAFRAAGLRPARLTPLPPAWTPWVLRLPDGLFRRVAAGTLRVDAQARSSMDDDLAAGRRTEIEDLQGQVVQLAARHGVAAPANTRLVELVHEAEDAPGARRRWSGRELLAELTAAR